MNPSTELSLFEIIEARRHLDRAIDAEFDALPVRPKRTRIYDWTRHCWRTVTLLDCGGKRQQAPAPELGPDELGDGKRRSKSPKTDQIADYIKDHGPSTIREIAQAIDMPLKNARSLISRNRMFEGYFATPEAAKSNGEKTWRLIEEPEPK